MGWCGCGRRGTQEAMDFLDNDQAPPPPPATPAPPAPPAPPAASAPPLDGDSSWVQAREGKARSCKVCVGLVCARNGRGSRTAKRGGERRRGEKTRQDKRREAKRGEAKSEEWTQGPEPRAASVRRCLRLKAPPGLAGGGVKPAGRVGGVWMARRKESLSSLLGSSPGWPVGSRLDGPS